MKQSILTEGERGYWKSFRAVPFHGQLLTVKNLNHSRSLAEPCDLCLSKAAILKLWRYLCSPDSPNFFTASEGLPEEKSGGVSLCAMLYALCVLNISDTLPILLLG